MPIIKYLSENLVNQIAAGEVVERPSSVVKELVENSLDAGATDITVEIKNSGKLLIKIADNGCGMDKEDCLAALERHTTSKIKDEKDLWQIKTMGFRGEALASISSVSQLTIRSRRTEDISGTEVNCYGGDVKTVGECGMNVGTQIEVRSLFFNTPARQKYLKKDATEFAHISSTLSTLALANPDISFKLIHNEKLVYEYPRVSSLSARISDVFGKATSEAMLPVFYGGSSLKFDGFVGKPLLSRSTSQHQYFFVNRRPIQNFLLANAIRDAYHSMLMENKKPVFVINIFIDPSLIDVNVHPRKLEIRFEDQSGIMKTMYSAVKSALESSSLIPKASQSERYLAGSFGFENQKPVPQKNSYSAQDALDFSKEFLARREMKGIEKFSSQEQSKARAVFQIANSYIVSESDEGVILIDQHAAHERVRYEQLMDQFENEKKSIQPLLVPLQIEFSHDEFVLIEENKEIFDKLGFEINPFGGKTFMINAVPSFLAKESVDEVIKGVIDDISNGKSASKFQGKTEDIINYMSCRSAIKFGQKLNEEEMRSLLKQMQTLKRPYTCPHGRPTMISLDIGELEKMFGRK
ncbi:MAG: DNA mismatch repair endonuclease MutL [Candidatus Gracilibacteria bacterium]|jgi:DNA mismatch repair protein MutL